jgi:hypothetical protein
VSPSELLASPSELLASPSELLASLSELLASPSELSASPSESLNTADEALSVTHPRCRFTYSCTTRESSSRGFHPYFSGSRIRSWRERGREETSKRNVLSGCPSVPTWERQAFTLPQYRRLGGASVTPHPSIRCSSTSKDTRAALSPRCGWAPRGTAGSSPACSLRWWQHTGRCQLSAVRCQLTELIGSLSRPYM